MTAISGRRALVTGGASGIGAALSAALIARGANVLIADHDAHAAEAAATRIGSDWVALDVTDAAALAQVADEEEAAGRAPDLLVLNAGVGPFGSLAEMTRSDWDWMLGVNLRGVVDCVSAFLPKIVDSRRSGHVVMTASMAALAPSPGLGVYAATKAGVLAFGEVLSAELAGADSSVGVTVALPGPTPTNIGSSQRAREDRGGLKDRELEETGFEWISWRTPEDVAARILNAVETDSLYAPTHPELLPRFDERVAQIRAAFLNAAT
ncbi:SDR family NAD(P)-dependent oxidoreductase [Agromyces sp. NPDC049794]|uniref:SDR family oxidoreductase n=1 Tax=unclassified Agromyces TaxID=2639701 RepID=UPI00340E1794